MTGITFLRFVLETLAVLAIGYCIYHEEDINRFERKAIRFLKRAKRIIAEEMRETQKAKRETTVNNIIELKPNDDSEAHYEYLLENVG
ncbi:MAG: hypothetical protein IKK46_10035 [Clostridia bacterium]|nr:hypothetical protein [Clostridia bacterium]